jgi:Glycosyl hydrolases family 15
VHSKVLCWVALDRGLRLAQEVGFPAPVGRWTATRAAIRAAVEGHGFDPGRGVFTQAFDRPELDAALLLLPAVGFVAWDDERMLRTVEAVRAELEVGGLLWRYRGPDGLQGTEGTFVACTFWLAECLARQGRTAEAEVAFARASATANDLGLFAEEFDPATGTLLGNFPQALTTCPTSPPPSPSPAEARAQQLGRPRPADQILLETGVPPHLTAPRGRVADDHTTPHFCGGTIMDAGRCPTALVNRSGGRHDP